MKLDLELTTVCNLDCVFCQRHIHNPPRKEITFYKLERLPYEEIDQIIVCGSYGDPFMYTCIDQFIDLLLEKARHCKVVFHTNGTMKNHYFWDVLGKQFKDLDFWVQFGIDGMNEKTYKIYRKNGNFNSVMHNMLSYRLAGGKTIWQFIIFRHNEDELELAEDAASGLKIKFNSIMSYKYDENLQQPLKYDNMPVNSERNFYCQSIKENMISMDFNGNITPCCHTRPAKKDNFDNRALELLTTHMTQGSAFFKYFRENYKQIPLCKISCGVKKRYELLRKV